MKKLLSIILAAAMIISLISSVFAEGEEAAETIVYDLTTGSFDMDNIYDFYTSENKAYLDVATVTGNGTIGRNFYNPLDVASGKYTNRVSVDGAVGGTIYNFALLSWDALSYIKYDATATSTYCAVAVPEGYPTMLSSVPQWKVEGYGNLLDKRLTGTNLRVTLKDSSDSYVAIRFKVEDEDNYDLTLETSGVMDAGCVANVYLMKATENEDYTVAQMTDNSNYVGTYITDSDTTGHGLFTVKNAVSGAGEYVLALNYNSAGAGEETGNICSLSSITLTPYDETAVEETVDFALAQKILHEGETLALEGVPYGAVLSSSDTSILTVNAKGKVTGVAMGKATVTADVNGEKQTIEIPVVGENLISSDDAYFKNGIYNSDYGTEGTQSSDTVWRYGGTKGASGVTTSVVSSAEAALSLPGRSESVNGLKVDTSAIRYYLTTDESKAKAYTGIAASRNKLYEFSGWMKLDGKENGLPAKENIEAGTVTAWRKTTTNDTDYFQAKSGVAITDASYENSDSTTGWIRFSSPSILQYRTNMDLTDGNDTVNIVPRLNINSDYTSAVPLYAYYTEFSLHEVVFDRMELSDESIELATTGENTATISVAKTYSNTGREIISINQTVVKGTPTYTSADTSVATVDESGVITAVSRGETTVTAETTIGGVTKTATVKVIVDGGEYKAPETVNVGILTNYEAAESGVTASGYTVNSTTTVSAGKKITAEAKDTDDYKFVCWKVGGSFLQLDAKVENYVVNTNTALTAVYEPINTSLKIVEFWNANKQFLSMDDDSDEVITAPASVPGMTGYTHTGNWLVEEGKYLDLENLPVGTTRALAEVKEELNAITGEVKYDGAKVSEDHIYGKEVTRTVADATYWTRDGKPVYFGTTYTYFMWDGTEIEAQTAEKALEPLLVLDDPANGAYMIEYCVPEGFEKIEAGILFATSGEPEAASYSSKAATQSSDAHGQFTAQADEDETVVRGYLIYEADGERKIMYTDVYTATTAE